MLDAPGLIDWVRQAKPADAAVYHRGDALPQPISAVALRLEAQGLVSLTRKRAGDCFQFIVQRRAKAFEPVAGRRLRRSYGRASAETIILRMIRDAIRRRQPCPTNTQFAEAANLAGRLCASYRLRKLVADGKIALIDHGPFEHRQAVMLDTGQSTVRAPL